MTNASVLTADMHALGIRAGDVVMVHASLRKLGPVDGGAAGVVMALDAAVGPDGTLLMMTSPADDWSWVNERPDAERAMLLADAPPYDYLSAPTDKDNGVLAEIFRQTAGTLSSNHPEGRFSARGRLAAAFVRDVPWNDYYGYGSPLARLTEAHGSVLRLGADIDTVTLLHYAEYLTDVPNKRRVRRHRRVQTQAGPAIRVVECLDDQHGIVDNDGEDYFGGILQDYLTAGHARRGLVGRATSDLIDAQDIVTFAAAWMSERFTRAR